MDKKKVIELIENAKHLAILRKYENRQAYLNNCIHALKEALEELSKSDWISVEDELPPIGMRVWVCNIKKPDVVVLDYRSDIHNCKFYDGYGFLIGNYVTHWRKIDKLEV